MLHTCDDTPTSIAGVTRSAVDFLEHCVVSAVGQLSNRQIHIAEQCRILARGFAIVGITALIDEATGYQEIRDRKALQQILDKYLKDQSAAWAKRFPDEFYKQILRLRSWQWDGMKVKRPGVVAAYTKDLVYARLATGVLEELERLNPLDKGRRPVRHHQWLSDDVGHPATAAPDWRHRHHEGFDDVGARAADSAARIPQNQHNF